MKPLHSTILASFGGILAALGFAYAPTGWFLPVGAVMCVLGLSLSIGRVSFPEERPGIRLVFGFLGAIAAFSVFGAGIYWINALTNTNIVSLMITLPWLVFAVSPILERVRIFKLPEFLEVEKTAPPDTAGLFLLLSAIGFDLLAIRMMVRSATAEAIRSPWETLHPVFFVWIFLATLALFACLWRNRQHHLSLFAVALHLFTILSPALLIYAIGYGFDPFIHIATEKRIAELGVVTPKPPYYLGQYSIVVIAAKLLRLPAGMIDRVLLPALAAVFMPLMAAYLLRRGFKIERHFAVIASLGVFLLPIAPFVATTPQGLGDLFALGAFLLGASWLHDHRPSLAYVLLLAAASLACHPLAGAPAMMFVGFLILFKLKESGSLWVNMLKTSAFLFLLMASIAAVPAMFALNAERGGSEETISSEALKQAVPEALAEAGSVNLALESRFDAIIDFVQLATANHSLIVIMLSAIGCAVLWRKKNYRRTVWTAAALAAGLSLSAFVLRHGIDYAGVADHEQKNYADRLLEIVLLSLSPLMFAGVAWWWRHLRNTDAVVRAFHVVLMAALTAAFAYAAFPRNDAFAISRGYSVSEHDVNAVRQIDERALLRQGSGGQVDYIVLANQSVAAAALQEFGFAHYYGDQYFYPIPTGGQLYRYYLDMVYRQPTRETMESAMRSVGVERSFFAINDYWYDAEKIIAAAKKTADDWFEVDGGRLHVFEYRMN